MEWTKMIIPVVSSFAMTFSVMPLFIGYFRMKQFGQEIREEGPKWHNAKAGTPTMGGVVFLVGSSLAKSIDANVVYPAVHHGTIRCSRLCR